MLHHLLARFGGASPLISASAQTTAGQFTGRITDPSGAVIAGATVLATNAATGATRETVSNELGIYTVPLLEPGQYTLTIKKPGFRTIERGGLVLHVNQIARMDFVMELGPVTESISVTADLPLLQAAEASLKATVDNRKIIELDQRSALGRDPKHHATI